MAAMAVRHWQRALRISLRLYSPAQNYPAFGGVDTFEQKSLVQPSALLPAMQELARRSSSSAYPSPRNTSFEGTYASDVNGYHRLIQALNSKRRSHLVRDVYDDMLIDGVQPIRDTFYLLIMGAMKGSRLQDVMYFFEEMKAMGLTPDVAVYNCVIAACGKSLHVDRAFQVADEMETSGIQPRHRTFLALLRSCALAGRVDEAYGVIRRMAASGFTLDKQFYCALIALHKNKKPSTEETVSKIFELLEQSKQSTSEDLMAVAATGEAEMVDDPDDGALNFLSDDWLPRRGYASRRLAVYHAAVEALASLGNMKAVKDALQLMKQDGHEPDAYCTIQLIKCFLAEGDFERACAEYNAFLEAGREPTLELYIVLIEAALSQCSPTTSAVAQKLLMELGQKGFFLNGLLGTQILLRACQGSTRDIAVASLVWDMMKNREVKFSRYIIQEYNRALEKSNLPKDDPRLIEVRALLDNDRQIRKDQTEYEQVARLGQAVFTEPHQNRVLVSDESSIQEQESSDGHTELSSEVIDGR